MEQSESLQSALHGVLDAVEDASPVDAVEAGTRKIADAVGATAVSFLIADLAGRALVRLTHTSAADVPARDELVSFRRDFRRDAQELATILPFDGGPVEQALRSQVVHVLPPEGPDSGQGEQGAGWKVLAPITERGDALGRLEVILARKPGPEVVAELARTAHLLGFAVVASRRHTDLFEWGQRSIPFSLSAEIQRRLLPPAYTCEGGAFTLSAWLEPADSVGGDAQHPPPWEVLLEQAAGANEALVTHNAGESAQSFSTGLLGRLDLQTGVLTVVNVGHAAPYLLRSGVAEQVQLPPDLPFALFAETSYRATALPLTPGDRMVIVTDGMLERNAAGLDLPAMIVRTSELHPRETTRALADMVLKATGHALADDATVLVLDWHGNT